MMEDTYGNQFPVKQQENLPPSVLLIENKVGLLVMEDLFLLLRMEGSNGKHIRPFKNTDIWVFALASFPASAPFLVVVQPPKLLHRISMLIISAFFMNSMVSTLSIRIKGGQLAMKAESFILMMVGKLGFNKHHQ